MSTCLVWFVFRRNKRVLDEQSVKAKPKQIYGKNIIITKSPRKIPSICFIDQGMKVLLDAWYENKTEQRSLWWWATKNSANCSSNYSKEYPVKGIDSFFECKKKELLHLRHHLGMFMYVKLFSPKSQISPATNKCNENSSPFTFRLLTKDTKGLMYNKTFFTLNNRL